MSDKKQVDKLINQMLTQAQADAERGRPALSVEARVEREKRLARKRFRERYDAMTWLCTHCGTVHEPHVHKQNWRSRGAGSEIITPVDQCDCPDAVAEREQRAADARAEALASHLARLNWMDQNGNDFSFYCPELVQARDKLTAWYCRPGQSEAILLAGDPGCGKSHLARCIWRAWHPLGRFISEPDLLEEIKAGYDLGLGSSISRIRQSDMLILDDVGAAHVRPESLTWLREIYWKIFERRAEDGLPTLLTSNYPLQEMEARLGQRVYDRLQGMMPPDNYIDLFSVESWRARKWRKP